MEENRSSTSLSVMLVEDQLLVRHGLSMVLREKGFCIVAETDSGEEAIEHSRNLAPAVILMNIGLAGRINGIEATRRIKQLHPDSRVIILTSHSEEREVLAALSAGADAYCLKDLNLDLLCQILEMVNRGAIWLDPAVARKVIDRLPVDSKRPDLSAAVPSRRRYNPELSKRERQVLGLLVEGKSNKEISQELQITIHTTKSHVCSIIQKLSVEDRTQAAIKAVQEKLVPAQERNQSLGLLR